MSSFALSVCVGHPSQCELFSGDLVDYVCVCVFSGDLVDYSSAVCVCVFSGDLVDYSSAVCLCVCVCIEAAPM